jgi:Cdc6-like AAA superfamily ATPase
MTLIYGEGREKAFKRLHKDIEESWSSAITQKSHNDHWRQAGLGQLRQWLFAADPTSNYDQALKQRQDATGIWLLTSDQYLRWKNVTASFLWLYGIPGSGKTILSSTIIEDILFSKDENREFALAHFYFNFNDPQKQTAESLLKSLTWQLLQ